MKKPHPIFIVVWTFWWIGVFYYIVLASRYPIAALVWLIAFGWFQALALVHRPSYSLSGVVGWYIWRAASGSDRSWEWLADVIVAPIMVLVLYLGVLLVPGWPGWLLGIGIAAPGWLLLRKHWRVMASKAGAWT